VAPPPVEAPAVSLVPTTIATPSAPINLHPSTPSSSIHAVLGTVMAPIKPTEPTEISASSTTNQCPVVAFGDDVQHCG
jgi:hypothetical protein